MIQSNAPTYSSSSNSRNQIRVSKDLKVAEFEYEDGLDYVDEYNENFYNDDNVDNFGLDNYYLSKDFLPERFDRHAVSDSPIKIIVFTQVAVDALLIYIIISTGVNYIKPFDWFTTLLFILTLMILPFVIFWVNYKLHNIAFGFYRLVIDLNVVKCNTKYYSGCEIPDFFVASCAYPDVTIQVPVYKECLEDTIRPTLLHCIREAARYEMETDAKCNVVVCDDGFNLLSEPEREARAAFYQKHNIGYTARPHPQFWPRRGRFKKAGNLNFSMNYGNAQWQPVAGEDDSPKNYQRYEEIRDLLIQNGAVFNGDVSYGDYVLLVDSDTRLPFLPKDENGCIKRLAKEMMFDGDHVLFIQCFTSPYMSVKSIAEKSVFHHTCNIYNTILMGTVCNTMAPLVGHNAFMNKSAMSECAQMDGESFGYKLYWAEDRISEDFDMMMRGCEKGYTGRYASYAGVFLEGVSFSYMTEYFKISKFACGAAELIYNPMSSWWREGVISKDLIGFVYSKDVEWYNKVFMLSYTLNFMALAMAHWMALFNLIFYKQLLDILPPVYLPTNLLFEGIFVWMVLFPATNYIFGLRMGFNWWLMLKQTLREMGFLTCLYGSISVKMSMMCFTHLFGWSMSFGATQKDDRRVTLVDWMKSTPMECLVYICYAAAVVARCTYFNTGGSDELFDVVYFGCLPMIWFIILFWAGPLCFDVLPHKKVKTGQPSYNKEERMFEDKYHVHVPAAALVGAIKVGSKVKMAPGVGVLDGRTGSDYDPNGDICGIPAWEYETDLSSTPSSRVGGDTGQDDSSLPRSTHDHNDVNWSP